MKNTKMLYIVLLAFTIIFACKKIDTSNCSIYREYRFNNITNDTIFCKEFTRNFANYPYSQRVYRYVLKPNDYFFFFSFGDSIIIYKMSDTLNAYVKFKKERSPMNYRIDFFDLNSWDSIVTYEINTINHMEFQKYNINVIYSFDFKKENVINE